MKNLVILLFIPISFFLLQVFRVLSMEETYTYKIITLDNVVGQIPKKHLLLSKVVCDLVKDLPNNTDPLPLPINFEMLPLLKNCLENSYILQDNSLSDNIREIAKNELKKQLSTLPNLHIILTFADNFVVQYLLEQCMQIWAKARYKPDENYNLPLHINKHIARYMERSQRLIGSVAERVTKNLKKNNIKLLEKRLRPTPNPLWSAAINNVGTLIAAGDQSGIIIIYNIKTNTYTFIKSNHPGCTRLQFNENDNQIWSSGNNETIKIWDIATGKNSNTFQSPAFDSFTFCYIPQHKMVITGGQNFKLCFFNLENSSNPEIVDAHLNYIYALESAHDGSLFASTSRDGFVRIWNSETKKTKAILDDNIESITSTYFNHANDTLICGSENGVIILYDIATRKQLFFQQGHSKSIWSVLFDKNDILFCSGSDDRKIKLWDIHTKLPISILPDHSGCIQSMALNSQKNIFVSASCDATIRLWDLRKLVNPIITLRDEFSQSTIEQILMLENADVSETPLTMTNPHRYDLFQSFSPHARRILLDNENITQ